MQGCECQKPVFIARASLKPSYQDEKSSLNKTEWHYAMEIPISAEHTKWRSFLVTVPTLRAC